MEDILSFITDNLPEPWRSIILYVLLLLCALLLIYYAVKYFLVRNQLHILNKSQPIRLKSGLILEPGAFTDMVIQEIANIRTASHSSQSALDRGGEMTQRGDPRQLSEEVGLSFDKIIEVATSINPLTSFALKAIRYLWSPLVAEIEVTLSDSQLFCHGLLRRGGQELDTINISVDADTIKSRDKITYMAEELVYKVLLASIRRRGSRQHVHIGTQNWQAARAHTKALSIWANKQFSFTAVPLVAEVEQLLQESIQHDPNYAMAHYNLALLIYNKGKASDNDAARDLFEKAVNLAHAAAATSSGFDQVQYRNVEGLAYVGISRCYSQERHRFGDMSQEVVDKARQTAQKAKDLLGNDTAALYALAFSWHCTETLPDIEKGRSYYEQIIRRHPREYTVVHNNLGYILMAGGELLQEQGRQHEAEKWYKQALKQMDITIEIASSEDRSLRFSYANRGNLHRLSRSYERAIEDYLWALDGDPERSTYTNGLNELACVYLDRGREDDFSHALHYHERALTTTEDRNHRLRLMQDMVTLLVNRQRKDAERAVQLLDEQKALAELDIPAWLAGLRQVMETAASKPVIATGPSSGGMETVA